jgi:hypothetical protein
MNITPGMTNAALADVLESIDLEANAYEPTPGASQGERDSHQAKREQLAVQQDALDEAIQRLRERGDEEDDEEE